eukprot:TRINITY_DN19058_c0_g1_i1.p1 TRINITY_DN19058_c0_g1~~TRINITY_DN19058_c0_g1_i1.p1  ORF type:complete len:389 (-),score=82.55 TRINITY_DN19058_c0_g1_i1:603-1769(-)
MESAQQPDLDCWEGGVVYVPGGADNVRLAWYGQPEEAWQTGSGKGVNCTDTLIALLRANDGNIVAANNESLGGDPAPGCRKRLLIKTCTEVEDAERITVHCCEGYRMRVPGGAANVKRAWYGDPTHAWLDGPGQGMICTAAVVRKLELYGDLLMVSNGLLGGDPVPCVLKELLVELHKPGKLQIDTPPRPRLFKSADAVPSAPSWLAFVRHAQAGHNVDHELMNNPDNCLTEHGRQQAVSASGGPAGEAVRTAQLIITSPLRRALETTELLLTGLSEAGAAAPTPRVIVHAGATERYSGRCDEGTPKSKMLEELSETMRSWEGWDELPERWWPSPEEDSWARAEAFIDSLKGRPEERVVYVGHGAFWQMILGHYMDNCEAVFCDRSFS